MAKRTCSIDGCERLSESRGWCQAHYMRWYTTGSVGTGPIEKREPGRGCKVEGCGNKHRGRGYCAPHLKRFHATGNAGPAELRPRVIADEDVTYFLIHRRIMLTRGPAKNFPCVDCDAPALHWSYDHADGNERTDDKLGLLYSTDMAHYEPRCVSCHWRFDAHHGQQRQPA